ncbi:MAG: hypothetical protein U0892_22855 [Pirellulales bacterium]
MATSKHVESVVDPMADLSALRTSKVDTVASLLATALLLLGGIVGVLAIIFVIQNFTIKYEIPIPIEEEKVAGRGDHAEGFERDIEPPGSDEVEEFNEQPLQETMQAVTDVASSVAAAVDSVDTNAMASSAGKGRGDSRPPGPLGEGDNVIPRFQRWELKFAAKNVNSYAQQLDFYNIELGCIGGNIPTVDYAAGLVGTPKKRSGLSKEEKRLYFMWRQDGPLVAYDRQLLTKAGIRTEDRQLLKFIPKELEDKLAQIEKAQAIKNGHSTVKEIAKTVFESQAEGSGFAFQVIDQRYRVAK